MSREFQVIPAIIPKDFEYLKNTLSLLKGKAERVQIDVTDGKYTPNTSWPYKFSEDKDFEKIISQDEGLPFWEEFNFDIDLMIENPEEEYKRWIEAGAEALIFHYESLSGSEEEKINFIKKVKEENFIQVAIAIQLKTSNEKIKPFLDTVDFVQFMGIEKIGYQGQEFAEEVLYKIKDLRKENYEIDIAVDGSVNFETCGDLKNAGANFLVSGSAILKSEDIKEAIEEMKNS